MNANKATGKLAFRSSNIMNRMLKNAIAQELSGNRIMQRSTAKLFQMIRVDQLFDVVVVAGCCCLIET